MMLIYYPIQYQNQSATLVMLSNEIGIIFTEEKPINLKINQMSRIVINRKKYSQSVKITYGKEFKRKPVKIDFVQRCHCEEFIQNLIEQNLIEKYHRKSFFICCCLFSNRNIVFRKRNDCVDFYYPDIEHFDMHKFDTIIFSLS